MIFKTLIILSILSAGQGHYCDDNESSKVCQAVEDLSNKRISDVEYTEILMEDLESRADPDNRLYYVGVITGNNPAVSIGHQKVFRNKDTYELPLGKGMWKKFDHILPIIKSRKNTLVYTTNHVAAKRMKLENTYMDKREGTQMQNVMYAHADYAPGKPTRNCGKVQGDKYLVELADRRDTTLLMPSGMWCPENLADKFNIIIATIGTKKINVGGVPKKPYVYLKYAHFQKGDDLEQVLRKNFSEEDFRLEPENKETT